jgi:hypothetical protein
MLNHFYDRTTIIVTGGDYQCHRRNTQLWNRGPCYKEYLMDFLSDTDAWIIAELKNAHRAKDWGRIRNVIDVMEAVHAISHSH